MSRRETPQSLNRLLVVMVARLSAVLPELRVILPRLNGPLSARDDGRRKDRPKDNASRVSPPRDLSNATGLPAEMIT
jgi:hypothetical protein